MKILMVAPNPFFVDRGFSVRVYDQACGLLDNGHDVLLTAYNSGRDPERLQIARIPNVPGYGSDDIGAKFSRLYLDAFLFFTSFFAALRFKPDVIHGHLHEGALIGIVTGKLLGIPVVLDAQGSLIGELKDRKAVRSGFLLRMIKSVERFIDKHADFIIVSSPAIKTLLKDDFGVGEEKIRLLPDGVNTTTFYPHREGKLTRETLGIPQERGLVIYMGTLNEYYGTDCLLKAIASVVKKAGDKLHFLIVGGPNAEDYERKAKELSLSSFVTFTGRVPYEKTPDYLALADSAVAPKLGGTEANLKLCYYMASGLPIVCFDTEINRKLLGGHGVYAALGDHEALAEQLLALMNDTNRRQELGRALRAKAEQEFSVQVTAQQLTEVYRTTITSHK